MRRRSPVPPSLFCDTSFFYAALDRRDPDHARAVKLVRRLQSRRARMVTTWEIVVETVTLLRYRFGYRGAMTFLETVLPGLHIVHLGKTERSRAIAWFGKLSRDHRISFCDAVSYVVVTERLDYMPCLAFDDDFERLGLTVIEDLEG